MKDREKQVLIEDGLRGERGHDLPPSAGLHGRIMAAVRVEAAATGGRRVRKTSPSSLQWWLAAAAAVAFIAGATFNPTWLNPEKLESTTAGGELTAAETHGVEETALSPWLEKMLAAADTVPVMLADPMERELAYLRGDIVRFAAFTPLYVD